MFKKLIAFVTLFALTTSVVLADTSQSSISPKATRASGDDTNFHLDLSAGFTSEHGNNNQSDGVYNYGAVIFKNLTSKLKVYFYGGGQFENEKISKGFVKQPLYGAWTYSSGLTYKINPTLTLMGSYDQNLGHNYGDNGPTVYHQVNLETMIHVF